MPIKSRVRVKLPCRTPIFMARLRDRFSTASVLDHDDDHVVLEFDRAEDAEEATRQPVTIQGHTLEMESLATGREATRPGSMVRSNFMALLQEKLSGQAPEGNTPKTEEMEESAPGQPQAMRTKGQRSSMPPPLPKRKPPPLPRKKPETSQHSAPVPGPAEDDNGRPSLAPQCQRPASAVGACNLAPKDATTQQRQRSLSPLCMIPEGTGPQNDDQDHYIHPLASSAEATPAKASLVVCRRRNTSGMETGAGGGVPPPEDVPRTGDPPQGGSAPSESAPTPEIVAEKRVTMWKSSNLDMEEKENNAASNTDVNTYLELTNVYETMTICARPLPGPSPPSTGSCMLDDTHAIRPYQLFGDGNDLSIPEEHAPPPPESQPRHGKESPFRQPLSSAENQARLSRLPNRPLPDIPVVQNAPRDEELSPHIYDSLTDYSSMFGDGSTSRSSDLAKDDIHYSMHFDPDAEIANAPHREHDRTEGGEEGSLENSPQPSRGQESHAGAGRGQGGDDDDDDDDDGPPELGAFLEKKKGAEDTNSKDKPKFFSRRLKLPMLHVKLLTAMGKLSSRPEVEVRRAPNGKVSLEGEEKAVLHMESSMQSESKSLHPVLRQLSPRQLDLLQSKSGDVTDALARLDMRGTWLVHDDQVYVAGADDPELFLDILVQQLDGAVTRSLRLEDELPVSSPGQFKMGEAFQFLKKNQDNLFGSLMQNEDPHLTVTLSKEHGYHYVTVKGKESVIDNVLAIIRIRLEGVIQEESVLRDEAVARAWMTEHGEKVIHMVQSKFSNYVITAEALPEESSAYTGNFGGSDAGPSDGSGDSGDDYTPSDDEISNSPPRPLVTPVTERQAAWVEGSALLVLPAMEVRKEDLLSLHVDAVVHGTDDQLAFNTKLGEAMLEKLGPGVQQMCQDHVRQRGPLRAGSVFCTDTQTRSKFKTVVHVSLPKATSCLADGRLKDTVVEALKAVKAKGHRRVALPALGAKSRNFSRVDAALSVLQGVAALSLATPDHGLHHVTLCDVNEDSHRVFKAVLPEVLALDSQRLRASVNLNASLLLADSQLQKPGSKLPCIQLVIGSIQNQQADVIVNSTRPDLTLDSGAISKSLLKAGGPSLQRELEVQAKRGLKLTTGKVCMTSGGQLQCRAIFHVTLPEYAGDEQTKVLNKTVTLCLEEAERAGHGSIAFPPLGVGNVHFPPHVVIATILKCVKTFRHNHSNPALRRVTLVAYPGGFNAIQPFRKVMADFIESDKIDAKDFQVLHKLKVGGITVEMKTGDITQQRTDAIVNSCRDDMNLEIGSISQTILKAAGKDLRKECSTLAASMAREKVVVSGPGKLGCKRIIHVVSQSGADHWRKMWPKVFNKCTKEHIESLAIPPIGTGGMKVSPWDMGGLLHDALKRLPSPGSLRTVRVVFPDQDKLDGFAKGFNEAHRGTGLPIPVMATEEVTLGSLRVAVAVGSITQEAGDAIVNFCHPDMDLSQGMLSSVIARAAGPKLQDECNHKKADMQSQHVVVTLSGNLKCTKVIHVPRADSTARLSEAVGRAVCTARDKNLDEISIPAPAIAGRFDALTVADAMFDGLKMAGRTGGTTVRVRIVLIKAEVVGAFVQQLRAQPKMSQWSSLPARMRRIYSTRRSEVRRTASDPSTTRTVAVPGHADLGTCTLPVRVRVTGMGTEVRSVANEVLKKCQAQVSFF